MSAPLAPTDSRLPAVADHARRYAATGGTDGHLWNGVPTLLLTTTGRTSGLPRRTPLIYQPHGAAYLVVASHLGADQHPHWYLNLRATPKAQVQVLDRHIPVSARTVPETEHAGLWERMCAVWPDYDRYQQGTARRIPLVVLQPR
jgi:deazaflavin-dependent oxidoreductase (nitroreductase family)